ncbi:MAG: KAP family NTPase [Erythrobacter sp.]|jgi:hypothetical protein|nr:KAP family NTPase [Erythrobacter sp.]
MFGFFKKQSGSDKRQPFVSDAAITRSQDDALRRVSYARRIAEILSTSKFDDGRVFAIRGDWGTGKTSLKNIVIEALDDDERSTQWMNFNPWRWSDGDAISRALYRDIASKLGGWFSWTANKRARAIRRYSDQLLSSGKLDKVAGDKDLLSLVLSNGTIAGLAAAIGMSLPNVGAFASILIGVGIALPLANLLVQSVLRDRVSGPLEDVRKDLESKLSKLDRTLVVFVDDIDRLEPTEIRRVFKEIKTNANLPNIVFVLLYQKSIVESALDDISDGEGSRFLEKIVQSHFDLPALGGGKLRQILAETLAEKIGNLATEANGFEQVRWGNILVECISPFISNLRDVNRYMSSVEVYLPLHGGHTVFEVNILDFLALEVLRVFEPDVHRELALNKGVLLQTDGRYKGHHLKDADRAKIDSIIELADAGHRQAIRSTLVRLFPTVEEILENKGYGDGFWKKWSTEKRVCVEAFFPRYFELQSPEGEVSESELVGFINSAANLDQLLAKVGELDAKGLLPSVANRMDGGVDRLPLDQAANLLVAIFEIGQRLSRPIDLDPFNSPWIAAWRTATWYLKRLDAGDRDRLALNALEKTRSLPMGAILIGLDEDRRKSDDKEDDRRFSDDGLEALKNAWLNILAEKRENPDEMLEEGRFVDAMYRWRDFSGSLDEPKRWIDNLKEDSDFLPKMLVAFMNVGTSQGWGDRVVRRNLSFSKQTMEDFFGIEWLSEELQNLDETSLSEDQAEAIKVLKDHIAMWAHGDDH